MVEAHVAGHAPGCPHWVLDPRSLCIHAGGAFRRTETEWLWQIDVMSSINLAAELRAARQRIITLFLFPPWQAVNFVFFLHFPAAHRCLNPSLSEQFQFTTEYCFSLGQFSLCIAIAFNCRPLECGLIYVFLMSPNDGLAIVWPSVKPSQISDL